MRMKFHLSNFLSHIETGTKFPVSILHPKWITPEPLSLQKIPQIIIQQKESEGLSLEVANTIATNWTVGMKPCPSQGFPGGLDGKNLPAVQETWVWSLDWEDPLEKGMASHASTLAWAISWIEEPGRLQSMRLQRVRHDWTTSLSVSVPLMRFCPHNLNTFQRPTTECYHLGVLSSKYEFGKYKNIQSILLLNEMKIYIAGLVICHFFWFFFVYSCVLNI